MKAHILIDHCIEDASFAKNPNIMYYYRDDYPKEEFPNIRVRFECDSSYGAHSLKIYIIEKMKYEHNLVIENGKYFDVFGNVHEKIIPGREIFENTLGGETTLNLNEYVNDETLFVKVVAAIIGDTFNYKFEKSDFIVNMPGWSDNEEEDFVDDECDNTDESEYSDPEDVAHDT